MRLVLSRYSEDEKQTIGRLFLLGKNDAIIDVWDSLELPWKDNRRHISCIPTGHYKCKKHNSPKFGQSLWLQNVEDRSEILIHKGNYHTDIKGCILIGSDLDDINKDGFIDVVNSSKSVNELIDYLNDINGIMIEVVSMHD